MTNRKQYTLEVEKRGGIYVAEVHSVGAIVAAGSGVTLLEALESAANDMAAYLKQRENKN